MKLLRISALRDSRDGHVLRDVLPGAYLCDGGLGFKAPGFRTHSGDGPGGSDRHVHDNAAEAFVILQGKAVMQIDGRPYPLQTGDICVVEPGEDHHLVSDAADPCVNLWLHAGPNRYAAQKAPSSSPDV